MSVKSDSPLRGHGGLPPDVEQRLRASLEVFRQNLAVRERSQTAPVVYWFLKPAAAALFALLALTAALTVLPGLFQPTWAQVEERFAAVQAFHATFYLREDALSEPVRIEFWTAPDGRFRMLSADEVVFGRGGVTTDAFRISDAPADSERRERARSIVEWVISSDEEWDSFSFGSLARFMPFEGAFTQVSLRPDAVAGGGVSVFDWVSDTEDDWLRVWVLRESRLPARVRYWAPRTGETVDVLLTYGDPQPDGFFAPDVFAAGLPEAVDPVSRAYLLMRDPAGRPISLYDLQ